MFRLLKYLIIGFLAGFLLFFCGFILFYDLGQAILMAAIAGCIYGLFCVGFMTRLMKTAQLEVNSSNRDPQKGLSWYADEIRQQIRDLRFKRVGSGSKVDPALEVYHPTGLYRVWERRIELRVDAYEVKVRASRFVIRVMSDLVEIEPVKSLDKKGGKTRP